MLIKNISPFFFLICICCSTYSPKTINSDNKVNSNQQLDLAYDNLTSDSSKKTDIFNKSIVVKISEIDSNFVKTYNLLQNNIENIFFERLYFEQFPNSFKELNNLFGYNDSFKGKEDLTTFGVLYTDSYQYIDAFFSLKDISKVIFINKLIDICKDGIWKADGIDYFKNKTISFIHSNKEIFFRTLSVRNESDIHGFWKFYFDEIHPLKSIPAELLFLKNDNIYLYNIMLIEFDNNKAKHTH